VKSEFCPRIHQRRDVARFFRNFSWKPYLKYWSVSSVPSTDESFDSFNRNNKNCLRLLWIMVIQTSQKPFSWARDFRRVQEDQWLPRRELWLSLGELGWGALYQPPIECDQWLPPSSTDGICWNGEDISKGTMEGALTYQRIELLLW
jgi:hypothetical protein